MKWTPELVRRVDHDYLVEQALELLKRAGFREAEKVANRELEGIDIVATRDDPISGFEKYLISVKTGALVSSDDVKRFIEYLDRFKADRGIIVTNVDFTKDAKLLVQREQRGRIILWGGERVAGMLNEYGIEPPKELLKEIESKREEERKRRDVFRIMKLDSPLLFDFNHEKTIEAVIKKLSSEYSIRRSLIEVEHLSVSLTPAYIVTWSAKVEEETERNRAVVFSDGSIVVKGEEDPELKVPLSKAVLNDSSILKATEVEVKEGIQPSEATLIAKSGIGRELGVPQSHVEIVDKKMVYVPVEAHLRLKLLNNSATATVDLRRKAIEISIEPLDREKLLDYVREACASAVGEEPLKMAPEEKKDRLVVKGETERFVFIMEVARYTGEITSRKIKMKKAAMENLIRELYPRGEIINLDETEGEAIADILLKGEDKIVVLSIKLHNGRYAVVRELHGPGEVFRAAKELIEKNFPIANLEARSFRLTQHRVFEVSLESPDGKTTVKVDGSNLDIIDYTVEISREKAESLVLEKYSGWNVESVEETEDSFVFKISNPEYVVEVAVSKDGKAIEEKDRVLREDVATRKAEEYLKGEGIEARVKEARLEGHWVVEFLGEEKFGTLKLDRGSGKLLEKEIYYTERALENLFHEHVKSKYGEKELNTEKMVHYRDRGYLIIKASSGNRLYYAKIDVKDGKILEEDALVDKGITAKLKKMQLESKYK
ncbi:restriction endonuclease [Palaeococcus ferrophilus]|uniref:restriction endonuclease n=1 Tax=Palaeococcus ferrophilus TaxID=83868 RepID=UPI00064FA66F|nr:restriction endonuclease [Palaeococcus ferrophilus]